MRVRRRTSAISAPGSTGSRRRPARQPGRERRRRRARPGSRRRSRYRGQRQRRQRDPVVVAGVAPIAPSAAAATPSTARGRRERREREERRRSAGLVGGELVGALAGDLARRPEPRSSSRAGRPLLALARWSPSSATSRSRIARRTRRAPSSSSNSASQLMQHRLDRAREQPPLARRSPSVRSPERVRWSVRRLRRPARSTTRWRRGRRARAGAAPG